MKRGKLTVKQLELQKLGTEVKSVKAKVDEEEVPLNYKVQEDKITVTIASEVDIRKEFEVRISY
ncbi:MAG: hypothetical protein DRJ64_07620 [Thermoprotei archaeon]|nr:MAG: hypothetical protein DRJ64_07620 [Thermoprotei archaeon]